MPQNTTGLIKGWAALSLEDVEERLTRGDAELEGFYGPDEAAELRALAATQPRAQFDGPRPRVVILPGIMGSLLQTTQGLIDLLWVNPVAFLKGKVNLIEMDETGERDADPRVHVVPTGLEMLYYTKFALALDKQVDLLQFPYDWRRDIRKLAGDLRAALERWAAGDDRKFTLVGHSMGGLVSRAYMALYPQEAAQRVERLIMLGTPNYGAPEAVRTLILGNDLMNLAHKLNQGNDGNSLVRRLPAIYQILPAPPGIWPHAAYPADFDLYDARAWPIAGLNQRFLDHGREFWNLLAVSDPPIPHYLIAGCNLETTTAVRIQRGAGGTGGQPALQVTRERHGLAGGDGTVPLASALLRRAPTYFVQCEHAKLPGHREVIAAVVDLAYGRQPSLPTEIAAAPRDLAVPRPALDLDAEAAALRQRIADGTLTAQDLEKLYFLQ